MIFKLWNQNLCYDGPTPWSTQECDFVGEGGFALLSYKRISYYYRYKVVAKKTTAQQIEIHPNVEHFCENAHVSSTFSFILIFFLLLIFLLIFVSWTYSHPWYTENGRPMGDRVAMMKFWFGTF